MNLNPYLNFNGQCEAAFRFYEECLGGKIDGLMTYGESPMADQAPPDLKDKIIHVSMKVGNTILMGSDCPPEMFEEPKGISVSLLVEAPEEAERVFNALAQGGKITMPIEKTFWSLRFGMLVDRFGIPWMVNCCAPME